MPSEQKFFIHYKNKPYRYWGIAKSSETLEEFVVYECLYENKTAKLWIRPRAMFEETVRADDGRMVPRFRPTSAAETLCLSQQMRDAIPHALELQPMNAAQFEVYRVAAIRDFAENKVRAGNWPARGALERSGREHEILLPQGVATPQHFVCNVFDADKQKNIGVVWLYYKAEERAAFIYDILIDESERKKGQGRIALALAEKKAKQLGAEKIGLHVFGFNTAARDLYESAGFEVTNVSMQKKLLDTV